MPRFVPSTAFTSISTGGVWFAFRRRALLLTEQFELPRGPSLNALGLEVVRAQLLGHVDGEPHLSAELPANIEPPPGMQFVELRPLFGKLSPELMALAGRAVQVMDWDRNHQFCGACGTPTRPHAQQRSRVCPSCGLEAYPRISPAMIVAVERGDEILLARGPQTPPGIYSTLAGFVDPGESVEEAVHREVFEETGLQVNNVRYFGSQPWPFPNSLMLGFLADYESGEIVCQPDEIEDAKFFRFDALPTLYPGTISISKWLIADFLRRHGRELP